MKLLVIDGNSILNRAFYAIKVLTTKDGRFTNGIYGFLNILLHLEQACEPDGVAVAFDLRAPTFRHKLYTEYKAGRKGMPDELAQQLPVLKDLLDALGYPVLECEGWEADDILGTLANACKEGDECFLATGDRDSLQLVRENVTVLLAATRSGQAQTVTCDVAKIREDYGLEPKQLIEVKALQGDASDHIPGVKGVGEKTALGLIQQYGSVDAIYEQLNELEIKPGVKEKLRNDKDMAYLSRELGIIRTDVPVDCTLAHYLRKPADDAKAAGILASLEMFKMIERFSLRPGAAAEALTIETERPRLQYTEYPAEDALLQSVREAGEAFVYAVDDACCIACGQRLFRVEEALVHRVLADAAIPKYVQDSKRIYAAALREGRQVENVAFDLMLGAYLLNPSASDYAIGRLREEYGVPCPAVDGGDPPQEAAVFPAICRQVEQLLMENGQKKLLDEIELPLARVLAQMEHLGFEADRDGITAFGERLDRQIETLTRGIFEITEYEFNLNSPKQLGEALFDKLGLPARKKTKSGYSTNADALEGLADEYPVVAMVLEYRTLAKLKSTYCDAMVKVIGEDGRIHSSFNQAETRTGRISSSEPNLQNIPVRTELGREMRRFFRAREGCVLVDADYSQIELRVLAHMADDETMIRAFNNGDDIHTITASQVFGMPVEMVTPLMRRNAKAVNFGIVYGIGPFSLAKDIGVSRKEAAQYIEGYLTHYSGVRQYMETVVEQAKADGYVSTLFGRRRYLPELTASNAMLRAFGERVARNMPIQGTAADIIKIAMIRVSRRLELERMRARLILQVHDELIVEAPEEERERAETILVQEMEHACQMKVRLEVDVHSGKTWYEAKE